MRRSVTWLAQPSILLLATLISGCMLVGTPQPMRFTVSPSQLDVLEVVYLPAPDHASLRGAARLTIFGSGHVRMRTGTSSLVLDDFASDFETPQWTDYREDHANVTPAEIAGLLQQFVDAGLVYPRGRQVSPPKEIPFPIVRIAGKISGNRVNRVVTEPKLIAIVERILAAFAF